MKTSAYSVLAVALCACATKVWYHPSKGQQDFYRENSQCMAMAGSGQANPIVAGNTPFAQGYNQGAAMGAQANKQMIYEQCMFGNGWSLESTAERSGRDDCRADERVLVRGRFVCP